MTSKVTIICRRPGMYRNGVAHEAKAVYDADHWTPEQILNFRNDPAFEVIEGDDLSDVVKKLSGENEVFATALSDLNEKLQAVKAERDELRDQLTQAKSLVGKLETEIADAKAATEAAQFELDQLKAAATKSADEKTAVKK